jgi:hypothetical protein
VSSSPASALSLADLARACQLGSIKDPALHTLPTTIEALDSALPFGGWPIGAVAEIMPRTEGIGELQLTMPALANLTHAQRYIALIAPPHLPYPPALAQRGILIERVITIDTSSLAAALWATEQCLRCPAFGAVLAWPESISAKELRRLQLAAESGKNLALVYRPFSAAAFSSPAALRLCLSRNDDTLHIEIKKCRGGSAGKIVRCKLGADDTPFHRAA